jgi:hypothetical protein
LGDLPLLKKTGLLLRATWPHILTLVYFHGRPAHTYSKWSIFRGDEHTHTDLFSQATCLHMFILVYIQGRPTHTLIMVYVHGRPTHTCSSWSSFRGDRTTHSHGLFSWATCPHTHTGLFSQVTYPHMFSLVYFQGWPSHTLTLVYFHGRPTHTYSLWSIFRGNLPFWLGLPKILFGNREPKSVQLG